MNSINKKNNNDDKALKTISHANKRATILIIGSIITLTALIVFIVYYYNR